MLPRNELLASLALSSRLGVGSITYRKLIDFAGGAERIFSIPPSELRDVPEIRGETVRTITEFQDWEPIQIELEQVEATGARLVPWQDPSYPQNLRQIHDPPPILYLRGEILEQDALALAVVGSRYPTEYGTSVVEMIVRDLASRGITIVSGLARGIDTLSHATSLAQRGRTLAVLGSGIDIVYPRENEPLFSDITRNGAVLTEFPLATPPAPEHFPRRNRIISGLSLGVLVIEASVRSGSLITASFALEQGREVFAVPGKITSARSRGTNQLIQQGAKLVSNADDILEELSSFLDTDMLSPASSHRAGDVPSPPPTYHFTPGEETLFNLIQEEPVSIDQIISQTGMPLGEISDGLLSLELKGIILRLPGQQYSRKLLEKV